MLHARMQKMSGAAAAGLLHGMRRRDGLHAKRAADEYGVPAREVLDEVGRCGMTNGQEDMIEGASMTLARACGIEICAAL